MATKDNLLIPLGAGAAVGALVGILLVALSGYFYVSRIRSRAMRGWNEVQVLSLTRDVRKGEAVAEADLAPVSVPDKCTSAQTFRPGKRPNGARARVDLQKGDVLDATMLVGGSP